jgi:L-glutamine-phosphate cytidylyltransferase
MDALILAAGSGRRLRHDRPKCLVELGGRYLIDHQLHALAWAGVDRVVVVAGYRSDEVREALPPGTPVVLNPDYAQTNSLYSFWLARQAVGEEVLVLNSDVLFHPVIARALVRRSRSALAYDSRSGREEEEMKLIIRGGGLAAMSKTLAPERSCGENVGMIRLSGAATEAAFDIAGRLVAAGREQDWLASAINRVAREHRLDCMDVAGLPWTEIDFPDDLRHARESVLPAISWAPEPVRRPVTAAA